jgi:hypothetical protein
MLCCMQGLVEVQIHQLLCLCAVFALQDLRGLVVLMVGTLYVK